MRAQPSPIVPRRKRTSIGVITELDGVADVSLVAARHPRHRQVFAALRQRGWRVEVVDRGRPPTGRTVVHCDQPGPAVRAEGATHVELVFDCAPGDWTVTAGERSKVFVLASSPIEAAAAIERTCLWRG
jgi:hypothetical protein